jgi:hypothetical protein
MLFMLEQWTNPKINSNVSFAVSGGFQGWWLFCQWSNGNASRRLVIMRLLKWFAWSETNLRRPFVDRRGIQRGIGRLVFTTNDLI